MNKDFMVLFYEDNEPINPRCVKRFVCSFPKGYQEAVRVIIENSERMNEEVFNFNVAKLLSSFKMTRRGALRGIKIEEGQSQDPKDVIRKCWVKVGKKVQALHQFRRKNQSGKRGRILVSFSPELRERITAMTSEVFENLRGVALEKGKISPVAASKIAFAAFPEAALPVDNAEWKSVFETSNYQRILSRMIDEIEAWEEKCSVQLESLDPNPRATLPGVYNVMAMVARPLDR